MINPSAAAAKEMVRMICDVVIMFAIIRGALQKPPAQRLHKLCSLLPYQADQLTNP